MTKAIIDAQPITVFAKKLALSKIALFGLTKNKVKAIAS
jgi:hypothetical protein